MRPTRILIVDDSHQFRRLMRSNLSLSDDVVVMGEAGDGREAIQKAGELQPDLILMDIEMKGMDGLDCTERILAANPHIKVVLLTIHDRREFRERGVKAGAGAYVLKDCPIEELIEVIRGLGPARPAFRDDPKIPLQT